MNQKPITGLKQINKGEPGGKRFPAGVFPAEELKKLKAFVKEGIKKDSTK